MKLYISLATLAFCSVAFGQLKTGFEASDGYTASAGGDIVTGVNGWFVPVAGSNDGRVYTYTGNTPGFVGNPNGGSQFLGCITDFVNSTLGFSRAQHAINLGNGKWVLTFEFNGNFLATPPTADNLGSVSLQPSTTANYFQTLYHWTDINNPTTFTADYGVDTTGLGVAGGFTTFTSPGAAWTNLPVNHWYRTSTTWDGTTNQVLSVSIQDLTLGSSVTTVQPSGWYLSGGLNNVLAQPTATALRFFSGGVNGNVMGYDNLDLGLQGPTTIAPTSTAVVFGAIISGNNASLASDDANALKICKAFVPTVTSPKIRFDSDFVSPFSTASAVSLSLKAKMSAAGVFKVRAFVADVITGGSGTFTYGAANQVVPDSTIGITFGTFTGNSTNVVNNISGSGAMRARVEIQQTGFSAAAVPCSEFELLNLTVTP